MVVPPREPADAAQVVISVGGFDAGVSARDLAEYLESVAGRVWHCRVKTSSPPLGSYPDFQRTLPPPAAPSSHAPRRRREGPDDGDRAFRRAPAPTHGPAAPPHAFVIFAHPDAARRAAAAASDLLVRVGGPSSSSAASRRRHAANNATEPFRFVGTRLEVGNLWAPAAFAVAWRSPEATDFTVDPSGNSCRLTFARDAAFALPGSPAAAAAVVRCDVKLEFSFLDVAEMLAFRADDSLLIRLSAAPLLYYRTAADDVHQTVPFDLPDSDDPWIRTTDVTPSGAIGRCWEYRVSFRAWHWAKMEEALEHMERQEVPVVFCGVECRGIKVDDEPGFGQPTEDLFFSVEREGMRFPVLFLLNVLVHKGLVNEHQLTSKFFRLLEEEDDDVNVAALTELLGEGLQVFYLCQRLKHAQERAAKKNRILRPHNSRKVAAADHNAEVRSMVITPTRAYCQPPQVELSNRVIRHYHRVADRFLRVTFMDEGMQPLNINALNSYAAPIVKDMVSNSLQQKTKVHMRVRTILTKGFHMCGRKYSFLAFSSNQLRNRSVWFFAEDGTTTAASIREWMGQFPSNNVAKHAARMGQCFTSTYATVMMQPDEVDEVLQDVERNGYNFSDGIGKITPDFAMEVAMRLPLMMQNYPPSAYQIRYAGFKGVIAVWPGKDDGVRISLRPSMRKFESTHSVLEVVSWTKFQPAYLNRQIITLLTSLGVPDDIFWQMQEAMLHNLDRILLDKDVAYQVVTTCCSEHATIPGLMLSAGFTPATEPHLKAMLLAIRSSQLQDLLEKTKIFVPKGRWLMGCLDELGILEQGQCFIRASVSSLDKYFVKHGSRSSMANKSAEVVVGTIVMAKNPCLHPGDVRILEAVDVPELHHLVDCLVFPKKGKRPHPNEASGSDLDGDVYFVTWDKNLVPPRKRSWPPMDYIPVEAKQLQRRVRQHVSSTILGIWAIIS
ncbi:unnamed protein product [Urochloa humidicola]